MLQPVRTKWRKAHKGGIHGTASRANFINYGACIETLTQKVTGKQIEAASCFNSTYERQGNYGQEYQIFQFLKNQWDSYG